MDYFYEWMENIAFYLIVLVAVLQMIPRNSYQKYVRFFAGMILILLLAEPILKMVGMTEFSDAEYYKAVREIEEIMEKGADFGK